MPTNEPGESSVDEYSVAVTPASPVNLQSYDLSELDQITMRIYHRLLFFFSLDEDADCRQIFSHLRHGLSGLLVELPAFGGEIVTDALTSRLRLEYNVEPSIVLHYRDLRDKWTAGTFEELREASFPMSRIGPAASMLIGQPGAPTGLRVPNTDAVASFIPGGMVLGISWHHAFMGIEGRSIFLERWSKHTAAAAQGNGVAERRRLSTNAWNRSLLSLPASDEFGLPIWLRLRDVTMNDRPDPPPPVEPARLAASYWRISAPNLTALAHAASSAGSQASPNDALCALMWRCITRARQTAGGHFGRSMLAIATDVRHRVPDLLPVDYVGYAAAFATPVATRAELCGDDPSLLPRLTMLVRQSLQGINGPHVDKLLRSIAAKTNKGDVVFNVDLPGGDVVLSNQMRPRILDHWWGPDLGTCAAMRLAAAVVPGSCNFMSQDKDGSIDVLTVLTVDAAQALREDAEFTQYLRFVCE